MTSEDLAKPDPMFVKSEMAELIKEARDKIKPVIKVMSDEELDSIIMTLEDAKKDKSIILHTAPYEEVLLQLGITLEELRVI